MSVPSPLFHYSCSIVHFGEHGMKTCRGSQGEGMLFDERGLTVEMADTSPVFTLPSRQNNGGLQVNSGVGLSATINLGSVVES